MNHTPIRAKQLSIIKLGGSLIAPKDWAPETLNLPVVQQMCHELAKVWQTQSVSLVVVVGSGNFGHAAVKKYGIQTPFGVAQVQRVAQKTGVAVVQELLGLGLPATLISPHDLWYGGSTAPVLHALQSRLIPVLYGDVIWEKGKPAEIFSGEKCVSMLVPSLTASDYAISRIIQAGKESGVYDTEKKLIPEINRQNWEHCKSGITTTAPVDVTGGMLHKVEVSLDIAETHHIPTYVIDGTIQDRIYRCTLGQDVPGTRILAA